MIDRAELQQALWPAITPAVQLQQAHGNLETDVVVIGAGLTGLFTALHLLEKGRKTIVLEAEHPGFGASGRNAAGCVPMWLAHLPSEVEAKLGSITGARLNALHSKAPATLAELVRRYEIKCDLQNRGATIFAHRDKAVPRLKEMCDEWNQRGGAVTFAEGSLSHPSGVRAAASATFSEGATINPLALTNGLAAAVVRLGGQIFGRSPVTTLIRNTSGWIASTAKARVTAKEVVVATEGYEAVPGLTPRLRQSYMTVPFAIVASAPLERIEDVLPGRQPIADTNRTDPLWMMADQDDRLLISLLPPRSQAASLRSMGELASARIAKLIPALPTIEWQHGWEAGIAISKSGLPRLMRLEEGMIATGGYCGQGILPALMTGREVARFLCGEADIAIPFEEPMPMHGRNWLPPLLRQIAFPLARLG